MKPLIAVSGLVVLTISLSASAALIVHETPAGAMMNGHAVSARATFSTSDGLVTLLLENLQADPASVTQNISGFFFTIITGQKTHTAGTLSSSSSVPRTVADGGTYADGAVGATEWMLNWTGDAFDLWPEDKNRGAVKVWPKRTIVGPPDPLDDEYGNANSSIAGSKPHNPFLATSATFELDVSGVTAASSIPQVTFAFNTSGSPADTITVPEPATLGLLGLGGFGALWRRRRRGGDPGSRVAGKSARLALDTGKRRGILYPVAVSAREREGHVRTFLVHTPPMQHDN